MIEFKQTVKNPYQYPQYTEQKAFNEALESCQEQHNEIIRELFEEMEKHCLLEIKGSKEFVLEKCSWYQSLKEKYGDKQ